MTKIITYTSLVLLTLCLNGCESFVRGVQTASACHEDWDGSQASCDTHNSRRQMEYEYQQAVNQDMYDRQVRSSWSMEARKAAETDRRALAARYPAFYWLDGLWQEYIENYRGEIVYYSNFRFEIINPQLLRVVTYSEQNDPSGGTNYTIRGEAFAIRQQGNIVELWGPVNEKYGNPYLMRMQINDSELTAEIFNLQDGSFNKEVPFSGTPNSESYQRLYVSRLIQRINN